MSKLSEFPEVWRDEESIKKIRINEVPVMISTAGEIICIPMSMDSPSIGITGMKSSGKSTLGHSILDRLYWYQGKRCAWINDYQRETITYTKPNIGLPEISDFDSIANNIRANFKREFNLANEIPLPLPTIYFYPNTESLNFPNEPNHFRLSIPFSKLIRNSDDWLNLKDSKKYLDGMKDDLLECKSAEEVSTILDDEIEKWLSKDKSKYLQVIIDPKLINKIRSAFGSLIDEKIIDFGNSVDELVLRKGEKSLKLNPIVATYAANLVPSIITSDIVTKSYFPPYFKNLMDDIFQTQADYFPKEEIWLFADELPMICMVGKKKTIASETFEKVVTTGRPARIGMVWLTQNYDKVPSRITSNTNYLFTLRQKSSLISRQIAGDLQLKENERERILKLKQFEIMAMTNEKFICYKNGERYSISDEPIFGTALPPLSLHKPPRYERE